MAKKTASSVGRSNVRSGKRLENRYANLWSEWTGENFRRRRVEGRNSEVSGLEGVADIICSSKHFKFVIECKKAAGFSFMASPFSDSSMFWKWWSQVGVDTQVLSEIKKQKYYSFVHFKPTPNHDFIAFQESFLKDNGYGDISGYKIIPNFDKLNAEEEVDGDLKKFEIDTNGVIITSWSQFKESIEPTKCFYEC